MSRLRVALVPAYQPDEKMVGVVKELKESGFTVVAVNDGSGAAYDGVFAQACADAVVPHDTNKGKGIALKTGLRYISEHYPADAVVVTVDADGQHLTEDVIRVADVAEQTENTVVLGSRRLKTDVPARSWWGNFYTRLFLRIFTPVRVYDTQTGLRGFRNTLSAPMTQVAGVRYEYEMNVLIEMEKLGVSFREVPIHVVYIGNNESSHFRTWYDTKRIYKVIFSAPFRRKQRIQMT